MIKTPKNMAEKARVLATTFLLLHETNRKAKVDMKETDFGPCGTVACHAGWFAVSKGKSRKYVDDEAVYVYSDAAAEMAKFLGFQSRPHMEQWATDHAVLWGNKYGHYMFTSVAAFTAAKVDSITLKKIGTHWLKVADRLDLING